MDDKFLKERARTVRDLAEKAADLFIKKRLSDLADDYDFRIGKPSKAVRELWANTANKSVRQAYNFVQGTLPGAWLSSRSTLAAA